MSCLGGKPKKNRIINEEFKEEAIYDKLFRRTTKLLLLGTGESGKTTIIKQMKIIHINGFSDDEKREKIPFIKKNVHESIYELVSNMDKIDPPTECQSDEAKKAVEYLLSVGSQEPSEFTEKYFDNVKIAWSDEGVQNTFKRSNEFQLIDCAKHFLDRLEDIRKPDYMPTVQDILQCRVMTVGISKIEFSINVPMGGGTANFWMFDVGGQRGERRRWFRVFDQEIKAILFLIAASDFDLKMREDKNQRADLAKNRLVDAFELLENIYTNVYLQSSGLIVFLNKQDVLQRKINEGHKIEPHFPEFAKYTPVERDFDSNDYYMKAKYFMRQKIKDITSVPVTKEELILDRLVTRTLPAREVHVHFTTATDTNNIKKVFESVQEMILNTTMTQVFGF